MSKLGKICYLVFGLSIVVLFAARFQLGGWIDYLYAPLILAGVAFVAAIGVDFKFYLDFLSMRTTKHGMNMGVLILLAFLFVFAVNFLGLRMDKTFDLTREGINTLSDQSLEITKNLQEELDVLIFYRTKKLSDAAKEIKTDFRLFTMANPKVRVTVVNALADGERAKKYLHNKEEFAVVVTYKGRDALLQPSAGSQARPVYQEKDITTGLLKVTREKPLSIYFVTGHGEKDIDQASMDGLKNFTDSLRREGYTVAKFNPLMGEKWPEPPAILAIIGPTGQYTDGELTLIRAFSEKGGRLFIAIDPGQKHHLANLTKSYGVEFKNNYIANDIENLQLGKFDVLAAGFDRESPVTEKISTLRSGAIFPQASELQRAPDAPPGFIIREIVKSIPVSYRLNTPSEKPKNPEQGEYPVAMQVKSDKTAAVIFGDSDFLGDAYIGTWVNLDLAMNAMAYLFDDSSNITIRPKSMESSQLEITPAKGIAIGTAFFGLPLTLIILAGFFWHRRRSL